jgi:hypothetical protein
MVKWESEKETSDKVMSESKERSLTEREREREREREKENAINERENATDDVKSH